MNRTSWILTVLHTVIFSSLASAQTDTTASFVRSIQIPSVTQEELVVVPFDSNVFAAAGDGFPDIRVVGPGNQQVPFLLRRSTERTVSTVPHSWTVSNPVVRPLADDGLEIEFTLAEADPAPRGLRVVTPLKNFEQRIQIFGVAGDDVRPLVEDGVIFDYSQFMDVRCAEISFQSHGYRQFRISIDAVTSDQQSQLMELTRSIQGDSESGRTETTTIHRRPFRIDRIELWTETASQESSSPVVRPWPVQNYEISQDIEAKQTIIEIVTRREPITAFRLNTSSRNFSRRVSVQTAQRSGNRVNWTEVSNAIVSRFQLRSMQQEQLDISLPELRSERVRLVIDNRDSPPLQVDGIESRGHNYEVAIFAAPGDSFELQYGGRLNEATQHDTAALSESFRQGINAVVASLGDETAMPAGRQTNLTIPDLLNNSLFLGVVIGILVLLFGWGLFNASRRIDRLPKDDA